MEVSTKAIGTKIKLKDMELINGAILADIQVIGPTIITTGKEHSIGQMAAVSKVSTKMELKTATESSIGLMENVMMDIGS
jgi:hypothetical protein